jgi:hypothetical protein
MNSSYENTRDHFVIPPFLIMLTRTCLHVEAKIELPMNLSGLYSFKCRDRNRITHRLLYALKLYCNKLKLRTVL